ncbi:MAG: polysaccharide deacetylase family protein, partial [Myxococcales bacterium]|nr:polysaccharide deacetylase family protein [Myxococcales bacterium]
TAGEVVLTFDDGPTVNHTPRVLKLLERHGYAATFFLVGKNVRSNTYHLVQRMLEQGHTIGSHSYNHDVEMSFRDNERSVGYIHGQHETTQILIELALLATSPEDFRAIYQRVFGIPEGRYLSGTELRTKWPEWEARHFELLRERGYPVLSREDDAARRYPVVYSRPPGGGPYLGSPKRLRKLNDAALERVGFLNVLWHDASGDTVEGVRNDSTALVGNLQRATRRGGVVLLHDYIRKDALETYLTELDKNDDWQVISLDSYSEAKYGCSPQAMRQALMAARPASD